MNFKNSFFPYWQIVYYYFRTWTKLGIVIEINNKLVEIEQLCQEKEALLRANPIDSQSINIAPFIPDDKDLDRGKKVNGRKQQGNFLV